VSSGERRWFDDRPEVTAEIGCGRQRRIAWRRGKLVLEDHDLLAERSLTALGMPLTWFTDVDDETWSLRWL